MPCKLLKQKKCCSILFYSILSVLEIKPRQLISCAGTSIGNSNRPTFMNDLQNTLISFSKVNV